MSGLLVADSLREAGWNTYIIFGFYGPMVEEYKIHGHKVHIIPHKNWLRSNKFSDFILNTYKEYSNSNLFSKLFKRIDAEIVYINTVVSFAGAAAACMQEIPCIWHLREMYSDIGGEIKAPCLMKPIIKHLIRTLSSEIISASQSTANNFLNNSMENSVHIIPNAVRNEFFKNKIDKVSVRKKLQIPINSKIIGIPGTLRPIKGHRFFLSTIAPMLLSNQKLFIIISGGGAQDYVDSLKSFVEELNIAEQVKFLGWLENMPEFYKACDIICIPSEMESFGRTIIETFASERPVIASSVGGMKEIITHKKTGFLFSPHDSDNMLLYLNQLINSRALRDKIGQKALKVAKGLYTQEGHKLKILDVVHKVYKKNHC